MGIDQGSVLDALPVMAWTALPDGNIDFVSRRWSDYTGLSLDRGHGWEWQAAVNPDDLDQLLERWGAILASGEPGEMEARVRRSDGQFRWFLIQCNPMRDDAGRLLKWCGVGTDVDDLRRAQEALQVREVDARLVLDNIPTLVSLLTPTGTPELINRQLLDYTGMSEEDMKRRSGRGELVHPDDRLNVTESFRKGIEAGSPFEIVYRMRRFDGAYRWFEARYQPLADADGRVVRWCVSVNDIDESKRAEEELAATKRDLQLTIDSIPVFVAAYRPDGTRDFVNRIWQDYVGLTLEEATGQSARTFPHFHPDDVERNQKAWRAALASGEPMSIEVRVRRADGQYRWHLSRRVPLLDEHGKVVRWYSVGIDIDDQKRAEQELRESESKARAIVDGIPGFVAILTPDGRTDVANRQMAEYHGLSADELKKWATNRTIHDDDLPRVTAIFNAAIASSTPYEIEYRLRRFDGVYRWFYSRGVPLRDDTGRVTCWYALQTDIDDRKRAEEALRESERNARLIVDGIPGMVAVFAPNGEVVRVNRQIMEYFGGTEEDQQHWATNGAVHPDDLPRVIELFRRSFASGEAFEVELRARRFDGVYRWLQSRALPVRDAEGHIVCWYNLLTDIDDRKRAEEALAANEHHLRLIVDTIPGLVAVFGPQGEVVGLNRQFLAYLDQTQEEFANWPTNGTVHPDDLDRHIDTLTRSLASGEPIDFETRLRGFDGIYRWFQLQGEALRDATGRIVRWYCLMIDIDERKRAEEAVAASGRNLRLIIDTIPALAWAARTDGTVEFLSQLYLDYAGLTAEEAQGWGWASAIHPDDLNGLAATWQALRDSGQPGEAEARLRRHDGEYRWFLFRANPLRNEEGTIVKWYGINTDIEDRKRSEEGFRAIVETAPECVKVIAADGTVLRTNGAGAAMAGVASPEIVTGGNFFDFVAPEQRRLYQEFHQRVCAGEKGFLQFDLVNVQGVRRHMETHAAPMRHHDGSIVQLGFTRDITERKRAEERLRRSEAFLAEGQQLARMGNLSWRVASGEVTWSEQLYRIFEFEPGTPVTLERIAGRVHPEDLPLLGDMVERAKRGDNDFEYQHRIVLPDRSVKHLHLLAHRSPDQPEIEYIGAVLDITQRRLAEEGLAKARSELAHVARVSSLGALTASIAHEVNQPLAGIITNASTCLRMLAADPPNVDGARETARRTIRDGNRAADVIARLRALFGKRTVTIEPVDLNEAVREVIALSWGDLQRSRVIVRTELADELPPVGGDRVQLQQVIMNLLRNAADAMASVDDHPKRLRVRTELDEDSHVRLMVEDAGVGLGPEGAERLFQTFYTTKPDGMGIGLSISRSIIERHNGRLWAQANDGPGATFFFSVPEYARGDAPGDEINVSHAPSISNTQTAAGIS